MRHRFVIHGKQYEVEVGSRVGQTVHVTVNGRPYIVGMVAAPPQAAAPNAAAVPTPGGTANASAAATAVAAPRPRPAAPPPPQRPAAVAGGGGTPGEVRAPIPGVVLSVTVAPGEPVTARTKLLVLEAMKMENEILAGVDGAVAAVHVEAHQEVRQGDLLVTIDVA